MLQIPGGPNSLVAIIEPANIKRMKQGKPLIIRMENGSSVMVCFTPDMMALSKLLTERDIKWPEAKEQYYVKVENLTPEKINQALKDCQNLPEVER